MMTCIFQRQRIPVVFQPDLVQSLLPRQFLDDGEHSLDCVSAEVTVCTDGCSFGCFHTFRVSEGDEAQLGLEWFALYNEFCVRSGRLEPCVESVRLDACPEGGCCLILC
jgi:hypothetical protein